MMRILLFALNKLIMNQNASKSDMTSINYSLSF